MKTQEIISTTDTNCSECTSDEKTLRPGYCAASSDRALDPREHRADLFLKRENAGITDSWYEG